MRILARTGLGWLGLALVAPMGVGAQDTPTAPSTAVYRPASDLAIAAATPAPAMAPAPAPAPVMAEAPHQHKGRKMCAKCAAKMAGAMPPGQIVGCEHSKNGVCTACRAALNMPGTFVVQGAPTAPAPGSAPGRALVSSDPRQPAPAMAYGSGDPAPVGVVQANFSQSGPMGTMAGPAPMTAAQPGRAVAESSNAGHDPYQAKAPSFPRPHVLGHLFGWSGIGSERADEKARRKMEAHAMISYDNPNAPVEELPASMVFGKKGR